MVASHMMAPPPMVPPTAIGQTTQGATTSIMVAPGISQSQAQMIPPPPPAAPLGQQPARIITQATVLAPPGSIRPAQQPAMVQGQRMHAPRQRNTIPSLMSLSFPAKPYTNSK